MEAGANYIYSLMLGYDRLNDAVKGKAVATDLSDADAPFTQVGRLLLWRMRMAAPNPLRRCLTG